MARSHAFNSLIRHHRHALHGGGRSMANLSQQTPRRWARPRVEERNAEHHPSSYQSPYNYNHQPQSQYPSTHTHTHTPTPIPIRASYDGRLRVVAHQRTGGATASSSIPGRGRQVPSGGGGTGGRGYGYFLTYNDLELALERRGLSMLRFMLGVGVTFVAGASLMWPRIKRWGAAEGTEIALTSLQAEELKEHAASLVNTLISEEETGKNVEEVMKLAITNLMADEELKHQMTQYMAQVMVEAMSWENVLSSGNNYVENVLKDEASINSAHQYFSTAAQRTAEDHDVVDAASKAIWSSIKGLFTWGSGRKKTTADQIEAGDGTEAEIGPGSEVSSSDDETKSADGVASASNSADGGDDDGKDTTKQ